MSTRFISPLLALGLMLAAGNSFAAARSVNARACKQRAATYHRACLKKADGRTAVCTKNARLARDRCAAAARRAGVACRGRAMAVNGKCVAQCAATLKRCPRTRPLPIRVTCCFKTGKARGKAFWSKTRNGCVFAGRTKGAARARRDYYLRCLGCLQGFSGCLNRCTRPYNSALKRCSTGVRQAKKRCDVSLKLRLGQCKKASIRARAFCFKKRLGANRACGR